jgi:Fur family ferric uptake transcriptional regulator
MNRTVARRQTPQRQVVLEELRKLSTHPTAAELYQLTRRRLPKISLGTVYRNLELLAQMGVIRKLEIGGSEARYDGMLERHYHVRCVACGRVEDARDLPAQPVYDEIDTLSGYQILDHRLEFVGICPTCRSGSTAEKGEAASREAG